MAQPVTPPMARIIGVTLPMAVQAIAALEDRITEYQGYANRGADVAFVVADCHALVATLREAFGLWPRSEAEFDALHEATLFDPEDDSPDPVPDIPLALAIYQAEGR
jgi:hypothetical protein